MEEEKIGHLHERRKIEKGWRKKTRRAKERES